MTRKEAAQILRTCSPNPGESTIAAGLAYVREALMGGFPSGFDVQKYCKAYTVYTSK